MKKRVSNSVFRLVLPALLGAMSLLSACKKDYVEIDDKLIRKYLDDNKVTNAEKQPSGLYFVPIATNPTGARPTSGQSVSVLYTGKFLDGTVFDASSLHGNTPISFTIGRGRVIKGWDEGIALMRKGEKAVLLIPSALAYGKDGSSPTIPSNTVLQFAVELVDVQ
jgi:FKBP-type peptidyl-prolyl cis-trans isomerase